MAGRNAVMRPFAGGVPRAATMKMNRRWSTTVVAALFAIATATTIGSPVVDNSYDKQQALVTREDLPGVPNGGCDDGRVANCQTLPLFNYTDLTLPPRPNNGDIVQDENCPTKNFERHLRCVDVFTRRCLTRDQRTAFYKLYTVPTLDMQELCTENGPYREEYLKHVDCLRTVHSEYLQCGRKHQNELSALMMSDHSRPQSATGEAATTAPLAASPDQMTANLVHLCGTFRGHLRCVNGLVRETCGAQTEAFASQFLSQMASSLLNVCEKYGAGDSADTETDGGSVSRSSSSGAARLVTVALVVVLFAATAAAAPSRLVAVTGGSL